ncbi:hypothetical protein JKF63_03449 [Porcisia hertigi]|uniref:Uncharacterized protein n=1 Tax=Porcisia hertigi TaxID=2761500 RepID=A0A836I8E3_9TRYP|nr:hypothetical protein JKF63_03449 [Porcisia hertigi]
MIPLRATAQRVEMLECGPCALRSAMRRAGRDDWTAPLADFAVDIVTGALSLTGATEVLVPASLVHYVESRRADATLATTSAQRQWPWPAWEAAVEEHRLVTLVRAQEAALLINSDLYGGKYSSLCVPVPAGPLVAQLDFGIPVDAFYGEVLPGVMDAVAASSRVRWRAWMRSALTCAYEGTHVPPIRVAEYTSQLLRQTGGCERVIWEAAVTGLTPRWLETASKTALAVGVSPESLALALPEESSCTARLLDKSVEVGITSWTTCAVAESPLYGQASPVASPESVQLFVTGWNCASAPESRTCGDGADSDPAEETLEQCCKFVDAVTECTSTLVGIREGEKGFKNQASCANTTTGPFM